jgi:heat shock protein HslJ
MKNFLVLLFAAAVFAPSCAKKSTSATTGTPALVGTYWKLVELNGQPFTSAGKPGFLMLQADGRFSASAGCNTLKGGYETKNNFDLSFKPNMASTMMACPDAQMEERFKEVLSNVNNYAISGNNLSLSKNRMAPMARFERAVQPK